MSKREGKPGDAPGNGRKGGGRFSFWSVKPLSLRFFVNLFLILSLFLGMYSQQLLAFAAPLFAPGVSVAFGSIPGNSFIGVPISFTLSFDNNGSNTGYGPFLDLILPANGGDLGDGVTFTGATYLGYSLNPAPLVYTFTYDLARNETCIQHPYALNSSGTPIRYCAGSLGPSPMPADEVVNAEAGDQLIVMLLPFGSYEPTQPVIQVNISADVSSGADPGIGVPFSARGGYRFGADPVNNPTVDPPILSGWSSTTFTPVLFNMDKWADNSSGERVTGPNWAGYYDLQVDVAPNQLLIAPEVYDYLPDNLQFMSVAYTREKGIGVSVTAIETPSPSTPGGNAIFQFPDVTGGSGANDIEMRLNHYVPFRDRPLDFVIDPDVGATVNIYNHMSVYSQWMAYDPRDRIFAHVLNVSVTGGENGKITTSPVGIDCGKGAVDCTEDYLADTPVTLTAAPDAGYAAVWGGDCAAATGDTCSLSMGSNKDVSVTFTAEYSLTVNVNGDANGKVSSTPAGITCGKGDTACTADFTDGTSVTLTAAPDAHYVFTWGGACTGELGLTCTVNMTAAQTVSIDFTPVNYSLDVALSGEDNGQISSAPAGILCGNGETTCTADFLEDSIVTLSAAADSGFGVRWGGACAAETGDTCTVTMSAGVSVSAAFVALQTLNLSLTGEDNGQVVSAPEGIACGNGQVDCAADFLDGDVVTLSASPDEGYDVSWGDDCSGATENNCTLTMSAARNASAVFDLVAAGNYTVGLTLSGAEHGQISAAGILCGNGGIDCFQVFPSGSTVTFTAVADAHYSVSWGGACAGETGDTCSFVVSDNETATASFVASTYALTVTLNDTNLGQVTSSPAGISCGNGASTCSANFVEDSNVTLSAAPDSGYITSWGGACAGASGNTCTVSMSAAQSVSITWVNLTPSPTPTATRTPYGAPTITPTKTATPAYTPTPTNTPVGVYTPIVVTRDPEGHSPQNVGYEDVFPAKSLAIQDGMSVVGGGGILPGKLVRITLNFEVSDYFAFKDLVTQATISDGLRWYTDATYKPTITIHDNPGTYDISGDFSLANLTVDESRISCLHPPDAVNCLPSGHGDGSTSDGTDGKTVVTFNLSDELIAHGMDGKLIGGCMPSSPRASGTGGPDPVCVDNGDGTWSNGKTYGTIVLYAQVQEEFSDDAPSGDLSVDQGDVLSTSSYIEGRILRYDDMSERGLVTDGAASTGSIAYGTLSKYIYAVNGVTDYEGDPEFWKDGHPVISPGDRVTYELVYTTNSSDMEEFKIDDFLPSPVFLNTEITTFDVDGDGKALLSDDVPAAGHAHLATDDTFYQYTVDVLDGVGVVPQVQHDDGNVVRFFYGSFDGTSNSQKKVHILFTVTVRDEAIADGLFLTNQARSREGSTNAGERIANSIVQIEINAPALNIQKGVVAVSSDAAASFAPTVVAYDPSTPSPVEVPFKAPETDAGSCPRVDAITWALSSNVMGTDLDTLEHTDPLTSNVQNLDAGDRVTFAIVVENTGSGKSGAFDIRVKDTLDARMTYVPGSLCVFLGDGTALADGTDYVGDLFSTYIEFLDNPTDSVGVQDATSGFLPPYQWGLAPPPTPSAPGAVDNRATGKNVILITYDVTLNAAMEASETLKNTAALDRYTSSDESTLNFVDNLQDSASIVGLDPAMSKTLVSSEIETGSNSRTQLAIGEKATYSITLSLPEGSLSNAKVSDTLSMGLAFVGVSALSTSPSGKIKCGGHDCAVGDVTATVTEEGKEIELNLGTVVNEDTDNTNADSITIQYEVLAVDRETNQSAVHEQGPAFLTNSAVLSWQDLGGSPLNHSLPAVNSGQNLSIIEPVLKAAKSVSINGNSTPPVKGDAGDAIVYTITIDHNTTSETNAFDVSLSDVLPNHGGLGSLILDPLAAISCTSTNPVTACAGGDVTRLGTDGTSWTILTDSDGFDLGLGDTATITVTGTLSSTDLRAGETFDNEVTVRWTSLDGDFSTNRSTHTTTEKSSERDGSDGAGGLNDYVAVSAEVSAQGSTPALDKRLPSPTSYAVGATVSYNLLVTLPEGVTQGLQVIDQLPDGMVYTGYQVLTEAASSGGVLSKDYNGTLASPTLSPAGPYSSGQDVTFTFGDTTTNGDNDAQTNSFVLRVEAQVLNVSANQAGSTLANGAQLKYTNPNTGLPATLSDTPVNITVIEPLVNITKTAPSGTPPDAGDTVTYQVTLANPTGTNRADAYDVRVLDSLPAADLTLNPASVTVNLNGCATGPEVNSSAGNTLDVTILSIPLGCSGVVVEYTADIKSSVAPAAEIENTASVTWTSQAGSVAQERSGADGEGGALNDYANHSDASFTTDDLSNANKSIAKTSEALSSGERLFIGEIVRYRLQVQVSESTAVDLQFHDRLPDGLLFLNNTAKVAFVADTSGEMYSTTLGTTPWIAGNDTTLASITPSSDLPDEAISTSSITNDDNYLNGTDVYFKLGNLTNADDDDNKEFVVVEFNALVLNVLANQAGVSLANDFIVTENGDTHATATSVEVVMAEPVMSVTKLATTPPVDAGDNVVYTLTLTNSASGLNAAPAFNVRLLDTLNTYLDLVAPTDVVVTSKPAYTSVQNDSSEVSETVDVTLSRIDPGASVELTITAKVKDTAPSGRTVSNLGAVTYTSLPDNGTTPNDTGSVTPGSSGQSNGERNGADGVGGALNDYAAQSSVDFTLATPTHDKKTPSPTGYAVGDTATFNIVVTLREGVTQGLAVQDDLPVGMAYVSHQVITDAASSGGLLTTDYGGALPAPTVSAPGGSGGDLTLTFGSTTTTGDNDDTNNSFVVRVLAQVLNLSGNQAGTTLGNISRLSYTNPNNGQTITAADGPENVTVLEPLLTVDKTGPSGTLKAGDGVSYTVTLANPSGTNKSSAYEVIFQDNLVSGLTLGTVTITDACSGGAVNNSVGDVVTVNVVSMPVGCSLTISYSATIGFGIAPGQVVTNTGSITWTSVSGTVAQERTGADGVGGALNDYAAQDTHTFNVQPAVPDKTITATSEGHTTLTSGTERLAVGEIVRYRAVVQLPASTSTNMMILDRLPTGLLFLNDSSAKVAFVSDNNGTCTPATMTSSTLGTAPWVCGSDADVDTIVPGYALPDTAVSSSSSANNDTYASGTDVYIKLGTVVNNDNDDNKEYVVLELNAIAMNISGNTSGTLFRNDYQVLVNGSVNATSSTVDAYLAQPSLTVSKVNSTTPNDGGDTVVYTLTVENTASGDNAAAAFEVRVVDVLNANIDLTNAANVSTSAPGYASVTNNSSAATDIADVTISRLDPGDSADISITASVRSTAPSGQTIQNTGVLTYTSLPGTGTIGNPSGSNTPGLSGASNGERDGSGTAPNTYTGQSVTNLTLTTPLVDKQNPTTTLYAVGDTVQFNILVTLREGVTRGLQIIDDLPVGLAYQSYQVISSAAASGGLLTNDYGGGALPAPTVTAPGGSGADLTLTYGDTTNTPDGVTDNDSFVVRVLAQVVNESGNQKDTTMTNSANLKYTNPNDASTVTLTDTTTNITVTEPVMTITKSVQTLPTPVDARGDVTYRASVANGSGATVSTAYDVIFRDDLPTGLSLQSLSLSENPANCADNETNASVGNSVIVNVNYILPGCTLTVDYTVRLADTVSAGQHITNTVNTTWTSMSGTVSGERTGADGVGGALNDYAGTDDASIDVDTSAIALAKTLVGSALRAVGETVTYNLVVTLPEGTTRSVELTDEIPAGMGYTGYTLITTAAASGGLLAEDYGGTAAVSGVVPAAPPGTSGQDAVFTFGDVVTTGDNNTSNNSFLVRITAQVLNESGNQAGSVLQNVGRLRYTHPVSGQTTVSSAAVDVTVIEPSISTTKSIQASPTPVDAGGQIQYRVVLANPGGANSGTAYEVAFTDNLPTVLTRGTESMTENPLNCANGESITAGGNAILVNVASIPVGCTLTVDYTVNINNTVVPGQSIQNTADTLWTSLGGTVSGERTGADGVGGALNDYASTSSASLSADASAIAFAKSLNSAAQRTIGDTVQYNLLITLPEGTTRALQVIDLLPDGLAYSGYSIVTEAASSGGLLAEDFSNTPPTPTESPTPPGTSGQDVTLTFGDTTVDGDDNANNNSFLVRINARVLNIAANENGDTLDNSAQMRYTHPVSGVTTLTSATVTVTLVEPRISLTKSVTPTGSVNAGDTLTYTLTLTNANMSAYEVTIEDNMPQGVAYNDGSLSCILTSASGTSAVLSNVGGVLRLGTWEIALDGSVACTYTATAQTGMYLDGTFTNTADADWSGMSGSVSGERVYDDTAGVTVDGAQDSDTASFTVDGLTSFTKSDGGITSATIGETINYTLTVSGAKGTLRSLVIRDVLPQGLIYTGNVVVNGLPGGVTPTVSSPNDGSAPVTVTWNFGNAYKSETDATLAFTARVANVPGNQADGSTLTNEAELNYNKADGSAATPLSASDTFRIVEPQLNLDKSIVSLPSPADAGGVVTYRATITNPGGANAATAYDVYFRDNLPASLTLGTVNVTLSGGASGAVRTTSGNSVIYTIASIPNGGSVEIEYAATLGGVAPNQSIENTADVTWTSMSTTVSGERTGADGAGGALNDYAAEDSQSFTTDNPSVVKTLAATSLADTSGLNVTIGEVLTYRLTVSMPEGATSGLQVTDYLPTGLVYVPASVTVIRTGFVGTVPNPTVTATGGNGDDVVMNFGAISVTGDNDPTNNTFAIELQARVLNNPANVGVAPQTNLANSAEVKVGSDAAIPSATVTAVVVEPQLTIAKTVTDPATGQAAPGQVITFQLVVQNTGLSAAYDVIIEDALPNDTYTAVTADSTPSGFSYSAVVVGDDTVVRYTGNLSAGETRTFTFKAQLITITPGDTLTNTARVTQATTLPGSDTNERDEPDVQSSAVVGGYSIDLGIVKDDQVASGVTVDPGAVIIYRLTYSNSGNRTATGVVITETVPAHTTFNAGSSSPGWVCVTAGSTTTCTYAVGTVNNGANGTVNFAVTLNAAVSAHEIDNTVSIDDDHANGGDSNTTNNTDEDHTPLGGGPDLTITKDDGVSVTSPGATLTYTLIITNVGNRGATGVLVTDQLPNTVAFVSASDGGVFDPVTRRVTFPVFDLDGGSTSVNRTVTVRVNDTLPPGTTTILTQATVQDDGTNGPDPTPTNNQDDDVDMLGTTNKGIISTNQTHTSGNNVAIGEIITYEVTVSIPAASVDNLVLTDVLGQGLAFVRCVEIIAPPELLLASGTFGGICNNPTITSQPNPDPANEPVNRGRRVVFNFGTVNNTSLPLTPQGIVVRYEAIVLNNTANVAGVQLTNQATWTWNGGSSAVVAAPVTIVEPHMTLEKTVTPRTVLIGGEVTYTLVVAHRDDSNSDAFDATLIDRLPSELKYVDNSLTYISGQAPTSMTFSAPRRIEVVWDTFANLRMPDGSPQETVLQFRAVVNRISSANGEVVNVASVSWTSLPGDQSSTLSLHNPLSVERFYDPAVPANIDATDDAVFNVPMDDVRSDGIHGATGHALGVDELPGTGFPAQVITSLPQQPPSAQYHDLGEIYLEVPTLNLNAPLTGVPLKKGGWDLTWLKDQIGYLEGTTYPTTAGNTGLTAHVYNADGKPGLFVDLEKMKWGDKVILRDGDMYYIYEVREVRLVAAEEVSVLKHKDKYAWVTLLTCKGYSEAERVYGKRVAVQAVLIKVEKK